MGVYCINTENALFNNAMYDESNVILKPDYKNDKLTLRNKLICFNRSNTNNAHFERKVRRTKSFLNPITKITNSHMTLMLKLCFFPLE